MAAPTPSDILLRSARRWIEAASSPWRISCREGRVVVRSRPARLTTELAGYVKEYFSVVPGDGPGQRVYTCEHEPWRREAERLWQSGYRDNIVRCPDDSGRPPAYAVMDPDADLVLLYLAAGKWEAPSMLAIRVVRAAVLLQLEAAGWEYLHAACLTWRGVGVAITGPKFVGKTTLALQLLARPGWRLVANDKLAVRPGIAGVEALGFPIRMGIRDGSLRTLPPSTAAALRLASDDGADSARIYVRPQSVAAQFGTGVDGHTALALIVHPRFDPAATRPELVEVDAGRARALLQDQCLPDLGMIAEQQAFLQRLRPGPPSTPDPSLLAQRIASRVRVAYLRHDRRHNDSATALLETTLERTELRAGAAAG